VNGERPHSGSSLVSPSGQPPGAYVTVAVVTVTVVDDAVELVDVHSSQRSGQFSLMNDSPHRDSSNGALPQPTISATPRVSQSDGDASFSAVDASVDSPAVVPGDGLVDSVVVGAALVVRGGAGQLSQSAGQSFSKIPSVPAHDCILFLKNLSHEVCSFLPLQNGQ